MSRQAFPSFLVLLVLAACQDDPRSTPEYQQLAEDTKRAEDLAADRDSVINELFGTFNRISENLRTISAEQSGLSTPVDGVESGVSMENRIMTDIGRIDALMNENKALIAKLRKQASGSSNALVELERTLTDVEARMAEKDHELADLKDQLASTNSSLATLIEMYRDKAQQSTAQQDELNTAWYIVGTTKELRQEGILSKEGGLAGIGGVSKLNTSGLPKEKFTQVDVTRMERLPLLAKKARLVTSHPDGSYLLDPNLNELEIKDPVAFWSISKYLVIVTD